MLLSSEVCETSRLSAFADMTSVLSNDDSLALYPYGDNGAVFPYGHTAPVVPHGCTQVPAHHSVDLAAAWMPDCRRTLQHMRARDRSGREYAQARSLTDATAAAIDEALRLVAALGPEPHIDAGVDVAFASAGDAVFARKRLNEALAVHELLDDVEAWVWESRRHVSAPLTDAGRANGFELRVRRR